MRSRFKSINVLYAEAGMALQRFPIVLVVSALAGLVFIVGSEVETEEVWLFRLACTLAMGIPLTFAIALLYENERVSSPWKLVAAISSLVLLVLVYFSGDWESELVFIHRFAQLNLAVHLLVAFIAFVPSGTTAGFWHFNARLFLRFLTSGVYSAVLFGGLAACLATVQYLLGVKIHNRVYVWLWVGIAFVFNTWFFLGRIPQSDTKDLTEIPDYPRELKIFTQYLLVPLITLYLLILYAYLAKILATQTWPKGTVGYLVTSVSVAGIFALLLVHPVQEQSENRWLKLYARGFYLALLPLLVLLFLGTFRRIGEYGITEKRYFLLVLDVWIAAMALYFTFSSRRNIKVIPITLCLIAFLSSIGPWGAYAVSRRSQINRLREHLAAAAVEAPLKLRQNISSELSYLIHVHGKQSIASFFDVTALKPKYNEWEAKQEAKKLMATKNLTFVDRWQNEEKERFHYYRSPSQGAPLSVQGYQVWIDFEGSDYSVLRKLIGMDFKWEGRDYRLETTTEPGIVLLSGGKELSRVSFAEAIKTSKYAEFKAPKMMVMLRALNGVLEDDKSATVTSIHAGIFLKLK